MKKILQKLRRKFSSRSGDIKAKDIRIGELKSEISKLKEERKELKARCRLFSSDTTLSACAHDAPEATSPVAERIFRQITGSDARGLLAYRYLKGSGVEIGAFHFPLRLPPGAVAKYYDYKNADDHRRDHPEIAPESIVPVDFVGNGETLDLIADESLDFLAANHMVEHCQDAIKTLSIFLQKLKSEGILFLTLPDKRYTFDWRRDSTPFEHLVEDFARGPVANLYNHYLDLSQAWSPSVFGPLQRALGVPEQSEPLSPEDFKTLTDGKVLDSHAWHFHAWTIDDMLEMISRLKREHSFSWELEAAVKNGHEVILVLRKTNIQAFDRADPETAAHSG